PNFKLLSAPIDDPSRTSWREVIPPNPDEMLERVDAFRGQVVLTLRRAGFRRLRIFKDPDVESTPWRGKEIGVPEEVYGLGAEPNPEYATARYRFGYSSPKTPDTVYEFDLIANELQLLKRDEVKGGFDSSKYRVERVEATASDGTKIPISLAYREGARKGADTPLLLYGYGSYGICIEPFFRSERISLLDRGVVFAIAHIRGGGELGRSWYENGKFLYKKNTFSDFIAAAEHLIDGGFTSPRRIAIHGGSAGGLLMGAVINARPELFRAVIADVPFVDVVSTMLDETLPLTITEYEEWGNPNEKEYYDYIRSYSPYDNVEAKAYPNLLITGGLNDPRVSYWEPAKWAAKLRELKTDDHLLLLKTNMGAGHGGASGRYAHLEEIAFKYAFVIDQICD
ncbi:MAG: prolyl oligopeptidase family serine peptidase, partial [Planctomycetota bacterium]